MDVSQRLHRPVVRFAGIGVHAIGDELLAHAEYFNRRVFESAKGLHGAINQQAFGRVANAHRRGVTQHALGQALNLNRQFLRVQDINVNRNDTTSRDANPGLWPVTPDVDLVFCGVTFAVAAPLRVVVPCTQPVHAGLLGAGLNRQNGVTAIDQGGPELRHVVVWSHAGL